MYLRLNVESDDQLHSFYSFQAWKTCYMLAWVSYVMSRKMSWHVGFKLFLLCLLAHISQTSWLTYNTEDKLVKIKRTRFLSNLWESLINKLHKISNHKYLESSISAAAPTLDLLIFWWNAWRWRVWSGNQQPIADMLVAGWWTTDYPILTWRWASTTSSAKNTSSGPQKLKTCTSKPTEFSLFFFTCNFFLGNFRFTKCSNTCIIFQTRTESDLPSSSTTVNL